MTKVYRKLLNGTLVNGAGLTLIMIASFVIIPIQISYLGLDNFGLIVISTMFSLQGFISMLDFGLPGALTRQVAKLSKESKDGEVEILFNSCLLVFLLIGIIVGGLLLLNSSALGSYFVKDASDRAPMLTLGLKAIFISYIWQFPLLILKAQYQGYALFNKMQTILVLVEIVRVLLIIFLLISGYGFEFVIICNAFIPALTFVAFLVMSPTPLRWPTVNLGLNSLQRIWGLSKLLFVGRLSGIFFNNSDKLIASIALGPMAVGLIEIFSKMPALINRLLGLSVSAIVPVVGGMEWSTDKDKVYNIYHNGFKIYFTIVSFPIIQLFYFTPELLVLWVGQEDPDVINCMRLMLLWSIFIPLQFGGNMLIGLNRGVFELTRYRIMQALLKVLSLVILVSVLGYYAVPVSYLVSILATAYLMLVFSKKMEVSIRKQLLDYIRIFFAAGLPIFPYDYFFSEYNNAHIFNLVISIAIIFITQIGVAYFGVISKNERRIMLSLVQSKILVAK